ncbi:MAG: response regulator transcription factor [Bacteroidetes bacterium]|nr:response regulator transcription factor [Bacteroidota bacterium]
MKTIIIEDESPAADKLESMLLEINSDIKILAKLKSVKESVRWFAENKSPELAFVDVQLSDESSFELFKIIQPDFPVIFTTAYDDYVLKSFEYNSIDYLLKPYTKERLKKALQKVKDMEYVFLQRRINSFNQSKEEKEYKKRFIVKKGTDYIALKTESVSCFYTEFKITFIRDSMNNKYIVDNNLSEIIPDLNPELFFRANRQYIVNRNFIEKFKSDSGKIVLTINPAKDEVIVSKENASDFRKWFKG